MDLAEGLINSKPDSALTILNSISLESLNGKKEKARYALLKSMAFDKNYVDTTVFDVLQPAIDYYQNNGSGDEKLRTFYYQGRIYQNRGENDSAMYSFLHGREFFDQAKDSMTMANLMVAQATILYRMYKFEDYITNNLNAACLYGKIGRPDYEVSCLANAMDGCVIKDDKERADSILNIIKDKIENSTELTDLARPYFLSYLLYFGDEEEVNSLLSIYSAQDTLDDLDKIDISTAYYNIGNYIKAKQILNSIDVHSNARNSLKYLSIKPNILEKNGDFRGALEAYREYSATIDSIHMAIMSRELLFAQKKHEMEKSNLIEINRRDRTVWVLALVLFMILGISIFIYNRYKLSQAKANNSILAKEAAEAERDMRLLEAENLKMRIEQMEMESLRLKDLLDKRKDLEEPLQAILRNRMEMLNTLLAAGISKNERYSKSYWKWQDELITDKEEFMKSTKLALKGLYPKFIDYLENHGLTEAEINYICLYAIGLRGTEVGEYIQIKRHYHISSDIRKKLGINEHETNIGIYIRNLMKSL